MKNRKPKINYLNILIVGTLTVLIVLSIPLIKSCNALEEVQRVSITGKWIEPGKDGTYLVGIEGETFCVEDSFIDKRYNSSDLYNKIEVGKTYTLKVRGVRIPFLSRYRNIIEARQK